MLDLSFVAPRSTLGWPDDIMVLTDGVVAGTETGLSLSCLDFLQDLDIY